MIPNKSNFKFQELTPITGVKPYVIRFWETEFPDIAPVTSDSGQKLYARSDVEAILRIKQLLFDEKLSIPEAKVHLKSIENLESPAAAVLEDHSQYKEDIRSHLKDALNLIQDLKFKRNWSSKL